MVLERSPTPAQDAEKGNEKGRNRNTGSAVDMRFGAGIHAVDMRSGDGDTVISQESAGVKRTRANYHAGFHAGDKRSGYGKGGRSVDTRSGAGFHAGDKRSGEGKGFESAVDTRSGAGFHAGDKRSGEGKGFESAVDTRSGAGFHAGDKRSGEGKGFGSAVDTRSGAGFHAGDKRSGDGKGGSVGNTGPFSQESAGVRQTRAPFSQESASIMRTRAPFSQESAAVMRTSAPSPFSQESAGIMRTRAPFSQESVDVLRTYASTTQESAGVKWTCGAGDPAGSTEYDETGTAYHSELVRENQELRRQLRAQEAEATARTLNHEQKMQEILSRLVKLEDVQKKVSSCEARFGEPSREPSREAHFLESPCESSRNAFQRVNSDHFRPQGTQDYRDKLDTFTRGDSFREEYVTGREYRNTERDNDSMILSEIGFGRNIRHEEIPINRRPYSENPSRSLPRNVDSDSDERMNKDLMKGLMANIPKFNGANCTPQLIMTFEEKADTFFELAPTMSERQKIAVITTKLEGAAMTFWIGYKQECASGGIVPLRRINTWTDLKQALREQFLPRDYDLIIREKIKTCTQKSCGTVGKYNETFNALKMQILGESERNWIASYVSGLNTDIQMLLRTNAANLMSLAEAQACALRLELGRPASSNNNGAYFMKTDDDRKYEKQKDFREKPRIICYWCRKPGHKEARCYSKRDGNPRVKSLDDNKPGENGSDQGDDPGHRRGDGHQQAHQAYEYYSEDEDNDNGAFMVTVER